MKGDVKRLRAALPVSIHGNVIRLFPFNLRHRLTIHDTGFVTVTPKRSLITGIVTQQRLTIFLNGASSKGRTQAFGACRGGSTPPAPDWGVGCRK